MSIVSFSQIDTLITLRKSVTTKVIKDLIRLDHMDSVHVIDTDAILFLTSTIIFKDSVISGQDDMLNNYDALIKLSADQIRLGNEKSKILEKKLKKEKRKKFMVGAVGILAIVLLIL